jgi:hypothetical protein
MVWRGKRVYIKHLSHFEYIQYEELSDQYRKEAEESIPNEKNKLKYLIDNNLWNNDKETEIERQRDYIMRLQEGRKTFSQPSMLANHDKLISEESGKLTRMLTERFNLLGLTAEMYAERQINDYYMLHNLFVDDRLVTPLFSEEEFEDLSDDDVSNITQCYDTAIKGCSEDYIRRLSVQDFFMRYYTLCDNNISFFYGKPICQLTHYQVSLGNYAKYYRSLIENYDLSNMTPEKRQDPEEIEKFVNVKKNADKALEKGMAPVNMSKDDIKTLGLQDKIAKMPNKAMNSQEFIAHMQAQKQG